MILGILCQFLHAIVQLFYSFSVDACERHSIVLVDRYNFPPTCNCTLGAYLLVTIAALVGNWDTLMSANLVG